MKVAFIIPRLVNQGPILVVRDLVAGLQQEGVECTVDAGNEILMDCEAYQIDFWKGRDFQDYDVVHSHGIRPDAYVYLHRSKMRKCRCISTLHNYMKEDLAYQYNSWISFVLSRLWLFFLRKHDLIVVLSKHDLDYYKRWLPEKKLACVYNAKTVDKSLDLTANEKIKLLLFKKKYRLIGVNALLTQRKGIDQLIKVLTLLPDYALVVVGDGQERFNLENQAKEMGVKDRCLFLGYQLNAFRYLRYYDVYGMVSRSEGFPLSLIEAAAYGVATVCSKIPIFEETFTDKEVLFFKLEDTNSLKDAILRADSMIGKNFKRAYEERYTLKRMVKTYLFLYCGV